MLQESTISCKGVRKVSHDNGQEAFAPSNFLTVHSSPILLSSDEWIKIPPDYGSTASHNVVVSITISPWILASN